MDVRLTCGDAPSAAPLIGSIVELTGSRSCVRGGHTKAQRKELLKINPLICFQGAGSWRGQWAEGLHVDLRHRLPTGGSPPLLLFFFRTPPELMGRWAGH